MIALQFDWWTNVPFPAWSLDDSIVYCSTVTMLVKSPGFVPGGIALALGMGVGQILKKYKIFLSHNFQFQFYTWPGVWGSCCWIPGYNFPTTVWRHSCVIPWPHTAFFINAWPYISVNSVWDNSASPLVCSWSCSSVPALLLAVSHWRPHGF